MATTLSLPDVRLQSIDQGQGRQNNSMLLLYSYNIFLYDPIRKEIEMKKLQLTAVVTMAAAMSLSAMMTLATPVLAQSDEPIYGSQLMNDQERQAHRTQMRNAATPEERDRIRAEHHEQMQMRAKEQGMTLPEMPRQGMGQGQGMQQGQGQGQGGMQQGQGQGQGMQQGQGMGQGQGMQQGQGQGQGMQQGQGMGRQNGGANN